MKQRKGFVEIPATTLNALKNMLFTQNENGTIQETKTKESTECFGFDQWAEMTTDVTDIIKIIEERTK